MSQFVSSSLDKSIKIAIVIPYFKINYFAALLEALHQQTNKNFTVYIGDDNSPDSPVEIVKKYDKKLNLSYHKFNTNFGSNDLVKHWQRCLNIVENESWVWLLPDDDLPSENVIQEFYNGLALANIQEIKVFRMGLSIIDEKGKIIKEFNHNNPPLETNLEFYNRLMKGKTSATLGDNIFNVKSLMRHGGLVSFPKAWGSDHATVLSASQEGLIAFLPHSRLQFRMSGENISSDNTDGLIKMHARIQFVKWLKLNESIFPSKPEKDFYHYFYWKAEHYVLNEWRFSWKVMLLLFKLRRICFNSYNILPLVKVCFQKYGAYKK